MDKAHTGSQHNQVNFEMLKCKMEELLGISLHVLGGWQSSLIWKGSSPDSRAKENKRMSSFENADVENFEQGTTRGD